MKIFIGILSLFFLSGCYQASLAPMIGPAASASQGNLAYSAATTGLSYGVKHKTGKFPVEHFIQSKKQKIAKKIDAVETFVEDKSNLVRTNIIDQKNNLKSNRLSPRFRVPPMSGTNSANPVGVRYFGARLTKKKIHMHAH